MQSMKVARAGKDNIILVTISSSGPPNEIKSREGQLSFSLQLPKISLPIENLNLASREMEMTENQSDKTSKHKRERNLLAFTGAAALAALALSLAISALNSRRKKSNKKGSALTFIALSS
jgi:hypothetical protein